MKRVIPDWILRHSRFQYCYQKWLATPAWHDGKEIAVLERQAKWMSRHYGELYVLDHIVPLNSPYVCGLHWHGNIQVITEKENTAKSNIWWPDMWAEQRELPLECCRQYQMRLLP